VSDANAHEGEEDEAPVSSRRMALVLIAISFAGSALLAEVALRLLWTNPYRTERPDHVLELRIDKPNRSLPVDRSAVDPTSPLGRIRTDERSYILPSRRFEDPDVTVAFLGGSTTKCAAVDEEDRFPARVSALLEERGLRVNALNIARSGNTTHDSLNVLVNHVVDDRPDVAVMMHASNDIGLLARHSSYRARTGAPMTARTAVRWALQEASLHSSVAGAVRAWATLRGPTAGGFAARAGLERERQSLAVEPFEQRLRAFAGICRAFGIVPVLMTQPAITMRGELTPDWLDALNQQIFNDAIRRVSGEEAVVLIDLARWLREDVEGWNEPGKVFYDGIHVTTLGSHLYADHIAQRLLESVLDTPGGGAPAAPRPGSGLAPDHDEEAALAAAPEDHPELD
jgi:lysophospholipase L1-like esterase